MLQLSFLVGRDFCLSVTVGRCGGFGLGYGIGVGFGQSIPFRVPTKEEQFQGGYWAKWFPAYIVPGCLP